MARNLALIVFLILAMLSGCGMLVSPSSDGTPTETTPSTVSTTASDGSGITGTTATQKTSANDSEASGIDETALPEIVIELSDLEGNYSQVGVIDESDPDEERLQRRVARSFEASSGERAPKLVLSTARLFVDQQSASTYMMSRLDKLSDSGSVTETSISGVQAQQVEFTNDRGLKTTVLIAREGALVYTVAISTPEQHRSMFARELFLRMIVDIESES